MIIDFNKITKEFNRIEAKNVITDKNGNFYMVVLGNFNKDYDFKELRDLILTNSINDMDGNFFVFLKYNTEYYYFNDKFGSIPIFKYEDKERIVLSNSIKDIVKHTKQYEINNKSIIDYFTFFWILNEKTFFKNISYLKGGKVYKNGIESYYWKFEPSNEIEDSYQAIDLIRTNVEDSIRKILNEDKIIASHLSGGIDSSVVSILIKNLLKKELKTYSLFVEKGKDESFWVNLVLDMIKSNHKWIKPNFKEIVDGLEGLINILEEPMAYPSVISLYLMQKRIKEDLVFTGRGVDELFSGYLWHKKEFLNNAFERRRVFKREEINKIFPYLGEIKYDVKEEFLKDYNSNEELTGFEKALKFDFENMLRYWLRIEYKIGDYFGQKIVSPFINNKVLELSLKISSELKTDGNDVKMIFKEAYKDILPEELLNRKKIGLNMPFSEVLRGEEGLNIYAFLKSSSRDFEEIDMSYVLKRFDEHLKRKIEWGWQIWAILSYIFWKRSCK